LRRAGRRLDTARGCDGKRVTQLGWIDSLILYVLTYSPQHRWRDSIQNFSGVFSADSCRIAHALSDRGVLVTEHLRALYGLGVGRGLFRGLLVNCISAAGTRMRRERSSDCGNGDTDRLLGDCRIEPEALSDLLSDAPRDLLLD
jgi:hypothetical protein